MKPNLQMEAGFLVPCWTGPIAVLYQSFDNSDGFVLMEGIQQAAMNFVPLVPGEVGYISNSVE